jgi:FMN phosphatase YigB (HAD superfamily)
MVLCGLTDVLIPGLRAADAPTSADGRAAGDVILERLVIEDMRGLYVGEMREQDFCHRMLDRAGWPTDIEHLQATIRRHFHDEIPGSADVLRSLARKCPLILLADLACEWVEDIREHHSDLLGIFHREFFSFDLHHMMAEAATYRKILESLSLPAADCMLIDANPQNISAAANAGIEGILFSTPTQLAADLASREI